MPISSNIDELDHRILRALQSDARRTNKDLAEAVGLAPSTTLGRVRELERTGVLRGYHADVAPAALGHGVEALVSVRLSPKNDELVR
ncbi:MAG: Lrp/AsnC family transcriptional regulator, partial [Actinomycetota bacterium]